MPQTKKHLAELLLESSLHGPADRFRSRTGFSPDIEAAQAILFSSKYDRQAKDPKLSELAGEQPALCVRSSSCEKQERLHLSLGAERDPSDEER